MKVTAHAESERFRSQAEKYAAYLETPEGRLRSELAFANLQEFLPLRRTKKSLCALDLGSGTGETAIRLSRLGIHITLLDSSQEMLGIAKRAAEKAGVLDTVTLQPGDVAALDLFEEKSFDLIVCHNILEYVDDPECVLRSAARLMRDSSARLSVLVRNRAGEVFKAAIQTGNLAVAENNLTAEWGQESLYGGRVRLLTPVSLQAMLAAASFDVIVMRGVRVLADYLPAQVSRSAEYDRILALERTLGGRQEYAAVARYIHCIAHSSGRATEDPA